ncbi:glycosyltransferase family 4 protein [Rothia halotolerans]|uniref:glycosyltransferase family 4 protein n=1 Tax=Rothia halotolerans TaxID=405770 RepID=UPI00101DB60F|nr:glycosyltransferase family 4 protein [Rothia halotolerans]
MPRSLLRNLVLMGRTLTQHAVDDPVHLVVQGSRRVPRRLSRALGAGIGAVPVDGARALAAYLGGREDRARELCRRALEGRSGGVGRRLAAEVALVVGGVDQDLSLLPAATRARALWKAGRISEALEALSGDRGEAGGSASSRSGTRGLLRRLEGEAATMRADFALPATGNPLPSAEPGSQHPAMRALHVLTNSLPHTQSGYTLRSHRLLSALAARGVGVDVVTRLGYPVLVGIPWGEDVQEIDAVRYRRALTIRPGPDLPSRLEQQTRMMAALAERIRPRVLHCTTNYTNALMTEALARGLRLPWVYEVRGLLEETWASGQPDHDAARASERFRALREQETRMMGLADHVVTLSGVMRDALVGRGIPRERITVLPNAVAERFFEREPAPAAARRELGLAEEGLWIGSVSSLVGYEGFDTLLRAVALLRAEGEDVRVLLVGSGAAEPALRALAVELGIAPAVIFTGRVAADQAVSYHRALDVFCVPRRDTEVCRSVTPLKPIEAMAAGTPVLLSDLPPLRELVDAGPDAAPRGALFRPEDAEDLARGLRRLRAAEDRARLGRAGREFARTRTWAANAEILENLYARLASEAVNR